MAGYYQGQQTQQQHQAYYPQQTILAAPQNIYEQLGQPQPQPHLQRQQLVSPSPYPYHHQYPQQPYQQPYPPPSGFPLHTRSPSTPVQQPSSSFALNHTPPSSFGPSSSWRHSLNVSPSQSQVLRPPPVSPSATLAQQAQVLSHPSFPPPLSHAPAPPPRASPSPAAQQRRPLPQPSPGANARPPELPPHLQNQQRSHFASASADFAARPVSPAKDAPSASSSGRALPTSKRATVDLGNLPNHALPKLNTSVLVTPGLGSSGVQALAGLSTSPTRRRASPPRFQQSNSESTWNRGQEQTTKGAGYTTPGSPVKDVENMRNRNLPAIAQTYATNTSTVHGGPIKANPTPGSPVKDIEKLGNRDVTTNSTGHGSGPLNANPTPAITAALSTNSPALTFPASSSNSSNSSSSSLNNNANPPSSSPQLPTPKFTPVWKRTIPEVTPPAWGYAAGMVKDPHPKPAAGGAAGQLQQQKQAPQQTRSASPTKSITSSSGGNKLKKKKSAGPVNDSQAQAQMQQQQQAQRQYPQQVYQLPSVYHQQLQEQGQGQGQYAQQVHIYQTQQQQAHGGRGHHTHDDGSNSNGTSEEVSSSESSADNNRYSEDQSQSEDGTHHHHHHHARRYAAHAHGGHVVANNQRYSEYHSQSESQSEDSGHHHSRGGFVFHSRQHSGGLARHGAAKTRSKSAPPTRDNEDEEDEDEDEEEEEEEEYEVVQPVHYTKKLKKNQQSAGMGMKPKSASSSSNAHSRSSSSNQSQPSSQKPKTTSRNRNREEEEDEDEPHPQQTRARTTYKPKFKSKVKAMVDEYAEQQQEYHVKPRKSDPAKSSREPWTKVKVKSRASSHVRSQSRGGSVEMEDEEESQDGEEEDEREDEKTPRSKRYQVQQQQYRSEGRASSHSNSSSPSKGHSKSAAQQHRQQQPQQSPKKKKVRSIRQYVDEEEESEEEGVVGLAYDDPEQSGSEEEDEEDFRSQQKSKYETKKKTPKKDNNSTPTKKPTPAASKTWNYTIANANDQRMQSPSSAASTSSPRYGIRDLPVPMSPNNSGMRGNFVANNVPGLPQPPAMVRRSVVSVPLKHDDTGSSQKWNKEGHNTRSQPNTPNNTKNSGGRATAVWPADLPRLPRTPGSSSSNNSNSSGQVNAPGGVVGGGGYFDLGSLSLDDPPPRASVIRTPSPVGAGAFEFRAAGHGQQQGQQQLDRRKSPYEQQQQSSSHQMVSVPDNYNNNQRKRPQSQLYNTGQNQGFGHGQHHHHQQHQQQHLAQTPKRMPIPSNLHQTPTAQRMQPQTPAPVPAAGIESPHPVGGRDKRADIQRLEDDSNSSGNEGDEYEGVPMIKVHGTANSNSTGGVVSPRIRPHSVPVPVISVNDESASAMMPMINVEDVGGGKRSGNGGGQVFEVPGVSVSEFEDEYRGSAGGPSISISVAGPDDDEGHGRQRPQQHTGKSQQQHNHQHQQQQQHNQQVVQRPGGLICGGCHGAIIGRIVSAMGMRFHPSCFKCTVCNELLEHVSSFEHDGRAYCHLDYHENFAPRCYSCKTAIIEEQFISLDDPALGKRTYHTQHFFCAECGDPFLSMSGGLPTNSNGEMAVTGDGEFEGFTVYKGYPYCEACHVRLRLPKCKRCKRSIRDHDQAVEALGGKWCWGCFVCASCEKPFENPSFFQRGDQPYCENCFSIILRNEI